MNRRDFLKAGSTLAVVSFSKLNNVAMAGLKKPAVSFPRYRGFNLLAKFSAWGPRRKFEEEDFEIMADWGFDFARIPMSYWNWASKDDWFTINEDVIEDIYFEETVEVIKDCYNIDAPKFIEIDWKATVENCLQDGYGHHFSPYDGSEVYIDGWYIFRTN